MAGSDGSVKIKEAFKQFDTNGTGKIPQNLLAGVMSRLGGLSNRDVETLMTSVNRSSDGLVDYAAFVDMLMKSLDSPGFTRRVKSLPSAVTAAGGIAAWNAQSSEVSTLSRMLDSMCQATTVAQALVEVRAIQNMGAEHNLWTYAYMRRLYNVNHDLYFATIGADPAGLLPAVYTPTVGEACQKFGKLPFYRRGCYLSITDRGNLKQSLLEYAEAELELGPDGRYMCDCIVFSDGGRILGLGDLGAWGMGIPIGKLDLYTVCAGVNPHRTVPVIIDAGCYASDGNTDKLLVRDHEQYTGLKQNRVTEKSAAGTVINSAYFGEGNMISEFMQAATELFGKECLLQFEDFNSNDAFPLLAEYRDKYLSYNDDIQGTAAVAVAALLGAMKLRDPSPGADLIARLRAQRFFFHGAGSANIGVMRLLRDEAGVPLSQIIVTNSRGIIWCGPDGKGNFRNDEQKEFAQPAEPTFDSKDLVKLVEEVRPSCVIGAVGVAPNCFTKQMIEALVRVNTERPVVFALSNPKSKAEITAENAYTWSDGKVIYGSGTWFPTTELNGKTHMAGQVNNVYIFPGVSYGAICCQAKTIPESFFMVAAEAAANSIGDEEMKTDSVLPYRRRIVEVSLNVSTAVVLQAQKEGLANKTLGNDWDTVKARLAEMRWMPAAK